MDKAESQIDGAPQNDAEQTNHARDGEGQDQALKEKVIAALREVYDPEVPVNIYDMGLIYEIQINSDRHVHIKMTLTSPACPVAESLPGHVQASVSRLAQIAGCDVDLAWEPPWSPDKMSDAAKLKLGML